MKQYTRLDNSSASITITTSSNITRVYFEIYDLDSNDFIISGQAASGASYIFTATIPEDYNTYDRNIKIDWTKVTASGGASNSIDYASLIRPYATASRIREIADISITVTDSELEKAEKKARLFLQSYLPMSFTKEKSSVISYGNNSDILSLPVRILELTSIYEDDILIYDSSASINKLDYELEISNSHTRIKIVNKDTNIYDVMEYPEITILPQIGVFKKDRMYKVTGIFGYEYVPNAIETATSILVEDYLCNDWSIRNKAIQSMKTDSYDIQYSKDFSGGTGNLQVDMLLSPWYHDPRFMVI